LALLRREGRQRDMCIQTLTLTASQSVKKSRVLRFEPAQMRVPIHTAYQTPEVQGFAAIPEIGDEDIEGAAAALETLYASLPDGQRAVIVQLLSQASQAAG
jgi:hypothetical protein